MVRKIFFFSEIPVIPEQWQRKEKEDRQLRSLKAKHSKENQNFKGQCASNQEESKKGCHFQANKEIDNPW